MPLKMLDATLSTFDGVFEKFRSEAPKNKANLILFLADEDPSTSLSWCPGAILPVYRLPFNQPIGETEKIVITLYSAMEGTASLFLHSDCVRAEPVIYKKLEESSDDVALLRAYVGDRPTWSNPLHPWRVDSRFKLADVPTLILWEDETIKGRLEDHEAHLVHKIDALVAGK